LFEKEKVEEVIPIKRRFEESPMVNDKVRGFSNANSKDIVFF